MSETELALDTIRKRVIYQNTIDTWIAACYEKNIDWDKIEDYQLTRAFDLILALNIISEENK